MIRSARARTGLIAGAAVALVLGSPASPAFSNHDDRDRNRDDDLRKVADRLDGPRGVTALGDGRTLVTENDGTFSIVIERRHRSARVVRLGRIKTRFAPAIDVGSGGRVYLLTTGKDVGGKKNAARLFQWRPGWRGPREVADIGAYQKRDKDPYDLERKPRESNPYGVEALDDGTVLVADAAGNDLLRVERDGDIETVARMKPRKVKVPSGLGNRDPEGNRLPRAGSWVKSESVPTSVTVGDDGYWYVGELRGWPATPKTSQIWRIKPRSEREVCDPKDPDDGDCRRYADGLTSIVDLAAGDDDTIYALSLSKESWLRFEMGQRGSRIGGLFAVERDDDRRHQDDDNGRDRDRHGWDDNRRTWDDRGWRDRDRHGSDNGWDDGNRVVVDNDGWSDRDDDRWRHWDDDEWRGDDGRNRRGWNEHRGDRDEGCDRGRDRDRDRDDRWDHDGRWDDDGRDGRRGDLTWFDDRGDDRVIVDDGRRDRDDDRRDGRRDRDRDDHRWSDDDCDDFGVTIRELVRNRLVLPGGVDVDDDSDDIYVVAPLFKRGALLRIDD